MTAHYPRTPDGRYFLAKGRLWRCTDPRLGEAEREAAVHALMDARRAVRDAAGEEERSAARRDVEAAKRALGERGPVWWEDGARDWTRFAPKNTPYADWISGLSAGEREAGGA